MTFTPAEYAMQSCELVELAIRRVSSRLKQRTPWDMAVTEALDELANEISELVKGQRTALGQGGVKP